MGFVWHYALDTVPPAQPPAVVSGLFFVFIFLPVQRCTYLHTYINW